MNRRSLFRTLFGAAAAVVAAPLIPAVVPAALPEVLPAGYFYAPYIPIVKRVLPTLIARDLVSVQPMSAPTGQVFHLNYISKSHV